jgi:hypothetical protein
MERNAGHAHHLKKRKVRDDRISNLKWLADVCHREVEAGTKKLIEDLIEESNPE